MFYRTKLTLILLIIFIRLNAQNQIGGCVFNTLENAATPFYPVFIETNSGTKTIFTDINGFYFFETQENINQISTFSYYNDEFQFYTYSLSKNLDSVNFFIKHQKDNYKDTIRISGFVFNIYDSTFLSNFPVRLNLQNQNPLTVYTDNNGFYHFTLTLPPDYIDTAVLFTKGFCNVWTIYADTLVIQNGSITKNFFICHNLDTAQRQLHFFGYVFDSITNNPVKQQPVYLYSPDLSLIKTTYTTQNGFYEIYVYDQNFENLYVSTLNLNNYQLNIQEYQLTITETFDEYRTDFYIHTPVSENFDFYYKIIQKKVKFFSYENSDSYSDKIYWNFGDGTSGEGKIAIHEYANSGVYLVSMYNEQGRIISKPVVIPEDNITLSGQVLIKGQSLNKGKLYLFYKEKEQFIFYKNIPVNSGRFSAKINEGNYLIMAVPDYNIDTNFFPHYIPTFYPNQAFISAASEINIQNSKNLTINLLSYEKPYFGDNVIKGAVVIENNSFLPKSFIITLFDQNLQPIDFKETIDGSYEFKYLPDGDYYLYLQIPDKEQHLVKLTLHNKSTVYTKFIVSTNQVRLLADINKSPEPLITVYPNPFNNAVMINSSNQISKIEIFDIQGKKIQNLINPSKILDLSNLENGIYLMKIYTNTRFKNVKLIKEQK